MFFSRDRNRKNMAQQMKGILLILMIVLITYVTVCTMLLERISNQAIKEMSEMSGLYTDELDNRFFRISRCLFSYMMDKSQLNSAFWKNVELIKNSGYSAESDYAVSELRTVALSYAWEYGTEYQFFLYLKDEDRFIKLSLAEEGYQEEEEMRKAIMEQISLIGNTSYSVKKKWKSMTCQNENYICKIAQNQDVYFGCYVNVKSILEPFSNIIMGDDGYVRLVDESDQIVGELTSHGIVEQSLTEHRMDKYLIKKDLIQAPFQIQMHISNEKIMNVMKGSLMFLLAIAAILVLAGGAILLYLKKYLLLPIQRFTDNLIKYDEGDYTFNLTEGNLLELEQIDSQFKKMIHQIRRLKITLYEQELERQKIEMDYLKLQIRPHFYLNCLNFIYSMIDFQQYENARKMTKNTADYLQYIFQNTSERVFIKAEAKHCEDYLNILLLRYPKSFEFYFEIHEEVKDAEIFPFLIQVFVENAAKHALTIEEKIFISVTAFPEDREDGRYVNLYISDTGRGFPMETLERLKHGEGVARDGRHLGIENCLKRFQYYYNEKGKINFDNSPLGGAIVDIHVPYSSN